MNIANLKKKILVNGLALSLVGDLISGMFFGVGYILVDHFNDWIDTPTPSAATTRTTPDRRKLATHPQQSSTTD